MENLCTRAFVSFRVVSCRVVSSLKVEVGRWVQTELEECELAV